MIPQKAEHSTLTSQLQDGFKVENFNVKPTFAVVVYTNHDRSRMTMTRHAINHQQLAVGEVINSAEVIELINSEASSINSTANNGKELTLDNQIINPCILAKNYNSIMWHRPRQRKTFYLYKKQITLNLPPLLFKYTANGKALRVFAVRHNKRPSPNDALYHAPFMNVYEDGKLCAGTMTLPENINFSTIDEVEHEFFNSVFTHPNHSKILRNQKERGQFESYTMKKAANGEKILISELNNTGRTVSSLL